LLQVEIVSTAVLLANVVVESSRTLPQNAAAAGAADPSELVQNNQFINFKISS